MCKRLISPKRFTFLSTHFSINRVVTNVHNCIYTNSFLPFGPSFYPRKEVEASVTVAKKRTENTSNLSRSRRIKNSRGRILFIGKNSGPPNEIRVVQIINVPESRKKTFVTSRNKVFVTFTGRNASVVRARGRRYMREEMHTI